jgi:hypothetical protein
MHLMKPVQVVQAFEQLGFPIRLASGLGILELLCVAAYLWRPSSVLGAILLTGYLGRAVSLHVRVGDPLFAQALFPVYMGVLAWVGLTLRNRQIRAALLGQI